MVEQQDAPEGGTDPDIKKYFDSKKYSTMILETSTDKKEGNQLVDLLSDPAHKHLRHDTLSILKNNKGGNRLIEAIKGAAADDEKRQLLLSACWESGIDFSDQVAFFNEIAINDNFLNCIEAITVIENMDPLPLKDQLISVMSDLDKAIAGRLHPDKEGLLLELKVIYNEMLIKLG